LQHFTGLSGIGISGDRSRQKKTKLQLPTDHSHLKLVLRLRTREILDGSRGDFMARKANGEIEILEA
jgi:hypothetical protein